MKGNTHVAMHRCNSMMHGFDLVYSVAPYLIHCLCSPLHSTLQHRVNGNVQEFYSICDVHHFLPFC